MSIKYSCFNIEAPIENSNKVAVFNTLSRSMLLLERELATSLRNESSRISSLSLEEREKEALQQAGILVDKGFDEISYFKYAFMKTKFNAALLSMFICFSSKCNFKCSYCYQDVRQSQLKTDLFEVNWKILFSFMKNCVTTHGVKNIAAVCSVGNLRLF